MRWDGSDLALRAERVVAPYHREPFRLYHDMDHPLEMLERARQCGVGISVAQGLAILFHDIVNVAGAPPGTCEAASAAMLLAYAPHIGAGRADAAAAAAIIVATDHESPPATEEADLVLDLDLVRLAVPYPAFVAHAEGVRHEWIHLVPDHAAFMKARAAFLVRFAIRDRIFRTRLFDEGAARANIARFAAEFS